MTAAVVGLGAVAATGTGYAGVAGASVIVVPSGAAGQPSHSQAAVTGPVTRTTAATSLPRQLVAPDVLAVIQTGIPAADLPKIKKLGGVRAVLSVSGGAIKINGKRVNVIGVNPGQFRSWTSPTTAGEQALWQALSHGQFVTSTAAQRTLGVVKGHAYPAVAARDTSSLVIPPSRWMYSWNHRSGRASAATCSMLVVDIVDSVYGSPCRSAARAAPASPSGCIIRVYPVGASTSGSGRSRSSSRTEVSTEVTCAIARGWKRCRRNARRLARIDTSSSAAPST